MVRLILLICSFVFNVNATEPQPQPIRTPWGPPLAIKEFEAALQPHQVFRVPANPDAGFYSAYFFSVPENLKSGQPILINPNNDGQVGLSTAQREYFASMLNEEMSYAFGRKLGVISLSPAFPRPKVDNLNGNLYLHALTRDAVTETNPPWRRVDLQLLAMQADLKDKLATIEVKINDQLLLYGFSAAGDFVTRFALIHPTRVKAVVAGGLGGLPILPVSEVDETLLTYPVGISDFEDIFNKSVDTSAYAKIPTLYVQGSIDENDSVPEGKKMQNKENFGSDSYSYEQAQWINRYFGIKPIKRLPLVTKIYDALSPQDFAYAVLPNEKHRDKNIKPQAADFFKCVLDGQLNCAEKSKLAIMQIDIRK